MASCIGSSPRARGAAWQSPRRLSSNRFIPACAGSRARQTFCRGSRPVHPRVRGEQYNVETGQSVTIGSSPRARGAVVVHDVHVAGIRFIPACAGSSLDLSFLSRWYSVHPRVRGEQLSATAIGCYRLGSSPRARGAGWAASAALAAFSVHPRVRGEQYCGDFLPRLKTGSSPRARGAEVAADGRGNSIRFIPACAGSRWSAAHRSALRTVHPRVRGEQGRVRPSPEMCDRFIPACAGSSALQTRTLSNGSVHPRVRGEQPTTE